jgi:hypothetical protein
VSGGAVAGLTVWRIIGPEPRPQQVATEMSQSS